jgi:spermidine/putrescine transport system permease protein
VTEAGVDLRRVTSPGAPGAPPGSLGLRRATGWRKDPWRRPRLLATLTWGYFAWSILPVLIAVVFSFNNGRSRSSWQGFSMRWWTADQYNSLFHDPALHDAIFQSLRLSGLTMLIAVPLGTAFAIGLDRWRGRVATGANFTMLLSFVMPEIILGVALFLLFTNLFRDLVHLGTFAQILGLVTYQVSYPVIIVRARLLSIGKEYEEAAMDLGATPTQSVRRVLLPILFPAIFASFALVFADSIDDFVTVRYMSSGARTEPLSVKIYSAARASPTPAVNAAATLLLVSTLIAITLGLVVYRFVTRGQRKDATAKELAGFQM